MSDQPRMILYARVSTTKDTQEMSLTKQIEKMQSACQTYDFTPVVTFEEQASGRDIEGRPKFNLALQMLENGEADGLIVTDFSRLTRSVGDLSHLFNTVFKKRRLLSLQEVLDTTTPIGRCVASILTAVNQMSRETGAIKTKQAMEKLKQADRKTSSKPPYGWSFGKDKTLVVCDAEQKCLARMMQLYQIGKTPQEISHILREEGYMTAGQRNGTHPTAMWTGTTVKRIVERELERRKRVTK